MGPSTDDYHHRRLREVALAYRLQLEDLRRGTLDTISTLPGRSIILPGRRMSSDPSAPSGANSTSTPAQSSDLGQQSNLPHAPIQPLLDRLNVLSQSSTSGNFGMEGSKAPPSQHTSDQYSVDPPTYRSSFSSSTSTITTGGSQPIPPHQPATHTQSDGYQHYPAHRPPSFTPLPPSADRQQSYEYTLPHWLPGSSQTNQSNLPSTYPAYNDHHLTSFYPRTELFPAHRTPARLSHNEIPSPPTLGPISSYEYNTFHTPRSNDQSLYSALGPESSLDLNDTALTSPITAGQYGYEDTPRFPAIRPPVRTRPSSTNNTVTISALATYGYPTPRPSASFPGSAYWITPNPYTGPETDTNSYRYDAAQYTPTVTTNNLVGFQSGPYRPGLNDGFGMGVEIIVGLGLQHTPMSSAIEGMSGYGQLLPGPGVPARSWKGMSMGSFDGLFGQPNIIPDQAGSSAIGLSPSQEAFSYNHSFSPTSYLPLSAISPQTQVRSWSTGPFASIDASHSSPLDSPFLSHTRVGAIAPPSPPPSPERKSKYEPPLKSTPKLKPKSKARPKVQRRVKSDPYQTPPSSAEAGPSTYFGTGTGTSSDSQHETGKKTSGRRAGRRIMDEEPDSPTAYMSEKEYKEFMVERKRIQNAECQRRSRFRKKTLKLRLAEETRAIAEFEAGIEVEAESLVEVDEVEDMDEDENENQDEE